MDNKEKNIQAEVEKTMKSLDDQTRLQANPWLMTRLEARLEEAKVAPRRSLPVRVLQPAMMACLLLFNIYTAYSLFSNGDSATYSSDTLADEYSYTNIDDQTLEYFIPE